MRNNLFLQLLLLATTVISAQAQDSGSSAFSFLRIPLSAHGAALGGENISLIEDDPTLAWSNPALLSSVSDKTLNLNYLSYLSNSKVVSAGYVKVLGERHTLGVNGQLFDYGTMDETNSAGDVLGTFSAKDISLAGLYSYTLSGRWAGGATARFLTSSYAGYSSFAIAFDLGLNYFDDESNFSASLVMKNVGVQLAAFDDRRESLPFDLQMGFTQQLAHAPIRLSVSVNELTRWSGPFFNHFSFGADFLPVDRMYLAVGYHARRGNELKAAGAGHGAGFSFGGGLQLTRFKIGVAWAKYHVAASSLLFNLSYSL